MVAQAVMEDTMWKALWDRKEKAMNFIKAKFMKDNQPAGRSYTYKTEDDVKTGDIVTNDKGSKLTVVDEEVDMAWVESFGADKIGVVKKYVEPTKAESEE